MHVSYLPRAAELSPLRRRGERWCHSWWQGKSKNWLKASVGGGGDERKSRERFPRQRKVGRSGSRREKRKRKPSRSIYTWAGWPVHTSESFVSAVAEQ